MPRCSDVTDGRSSGSGRHSPKSATCAQPGSAAAY